MAKQPSSQWKKQSPRKMIFDTEGSKKGHAWYKIVLPDSSKTDTYIATITYPMTPRIKAYQYDKKGVFEGKSRLIYDSQVLKGKPYERVFPSFKLDLTQGQQTTILINIETSFPFSLPIMIQNQKEHASFMNMLFIGLGVFVGGLLSIILFNLFMYFSTKEKTYALYVAYQLSTLTFNFFFCGLGFHLLPIDSSDLGIFIFAISLNGLLLFGILFVHNYFDAKKSMPMFHKLSVLFISLLATSAISSMFIPISSYIFLTLAICLAVFIIMPPPVLQLDIDKLKYSFVIAWGGVITGVGTTIAAYIGLLPLNAISANLSYISILWEAVFLSLAVGSRVNDLQKEREFVEAAIKGSQVQLDLIDSTVFKYQEFMKETFKKDASILFIDIVQFSELVRHLGAKQSLYRLSAFMEIVNKFVKMHHGVIDRSVGDGVLCSFTDTDNDSTHPNHSTNAFLAAKGIQITLDSFSRSWFKKDLSILPVRMGIHSDQVLFGNLGSDKKVDYTIIGNGVNFASRLKDSCNPNNIILSQECYLRIPKEAFSDGHLNQTNIQIKHHEGTFSVLEFSPRAHKISLLKKSEKKLWNLIGVKIENPRTPIDEKYRITLKSDLGSFRVRNFSKGGFEASSDKSIGRLATLFVSIETSNKNTNSLLKEYMLDQIKVEVRWSKKEDSLTYHGLKFTHLNIEQKELLIHAFNSMIAA